MTPSPHSLLVLALEATFDYFHWHRNVLDALLVLLRDRSPESGAALVSALKEKGEPTALLAFSIETILGVVAKPGVTDLMAEATEADRERWDSLLYAMEQFGS